MTDEPLILVDAPAEYVRRITLNRPEKRNAISTPLRVALLEQLRMHDNDPDVRVTIIRGAGPCFSSGYDLSTPLMEGSPFYSAPGDGQWARQANDTWFSVWDLAKPVIAQVHGYAIARTTR
jgi:enoyl-CoA hydratase